MHPCLSAERACGVVFQSRVALLNPVAERTFGFFFLPAPGAFRRKGPELFGISADAPPLRPFQAGAVEQMPFARTAEGGRCRGCWRAQRVESNAGADA